MAIEARGAKYPYVAIFTAIATRNLPGKTLNYHNVTNCFLIADSDDEAYGKACKINARIHPDENGWGNHYCKVVRLDGIDRISQFDIEKTVSAERPW